MKLSSAIVRAFAVFVAVCGIQTVAGMLLLSNVKLPAAPHAEEWILVSNALVVAALSYVALRSDLRGWRLGIALVGIPLAITCINQIESLVFLTNVPLQWSRLFAFFIVSAALIAPVWALLFGQRPNNPTDALQAPYHPIASKQFGEKIWKFVVCDLAYALLYITAGTIVFPFIKDFYATQHLPPMTNLLALQLLLRGPLFILLCLALVRMLSLPRLSGALAAGVVFTILSAIAPLLIPNPIFPDAVRWAHFCEVTSSNFVFSVLVAWLWGQPSPAANPQVLSQAA
jgi:hypothetical protein